MRLRAAIWLVAGLLAIPAAARTIEITRDCFEGFCVESQEPFIVIAREPAKGLYRLKIYRTQSVLYIEAGPAPRFPLCGQTCRIETVADGNGLPEARAVNEIFGHLSGRLIGPMAPCGSGPPLLVHLYAYFRDTDPAAFNVVRDCRPVTPAR